MRKILKMVASPWWLRFAVLLLLAAAIPLALSFARHQTVYPQQTAREYFSTLPPGSSLPSGADCAARVRRSSWEPRPDNTTANQTVGFAQGHVTGTFLAQYGPAYEERVTGNFTGTTDEILQWGACKWGFDEDTVRAQALVESNWHQNMLGDCRYITQPQTHGCGSVGILQVKGANIPPTHPGTWPYAYNSTAFNVDYALAVRRACFDGKFTWLGTGYKAGDIWGCIGEWYSGQWYDSGAQTYIATVKNFYNTKPWIGWGYPGLNGGVPLSPISTAIHTSSPTLTLSLDHTYYVSKNGNNADGKSWATAWNELKKINWTVIQPGDTILLDGGSQSMIYTTTLTIGKSGTQNAPIFIKRASDAGHDGHVILFGGRSNPLPYCGQQNYAYHQAPTENGIVFGQKSWIVIDGVSWHGIRIYGFDANGVDMTDAPGPSNDTLRNLEIFDNGSAYQSEGVWYPGGGEGVYLSGANLTFEQMDIHDNGDDEFNSGTGGPNHGGAISKVTINLSWMHITREDPRTSGLPFNDCIHQDGYQIWDGGVSSGLLIQNSIVGPGLGDNLILGQAPNSVHDDAIVNDVTLRNNLIIGRARSILGYDHVKETGWVIDHDTVLSFGSGTGQAEALFLEGSNNTVTNTMFYGGLLYLPDGLVFATNNCSWQTEWTNSAYAGRVVDPKFVTDVSGFNGTTPLATLAHANYALQPSSLCKGAGSSVASVAQFLNMVNAR